MTITEGSEARAMTEWRTAAELAERLGVAQTTVGDALRITGMLTAGRYHARGEGAAREYSPSAQGHVLRPSAHTVGALGVRSCQRTTFDIYFWSSA